MTPGPERRETLLRLRQVERRQVGGQVGGNITCGLKMTRLPLFVLS